MNTVNRLLRTIIAAQSAVLAYENEDVTENTAINALEASVKEIVKLTKRLRKE